MLYEILDTPSVIIDMKKVRNNILQMQREIDKHGVKLRPHIKTHKIPELAIMQLAAGASGITCAKLSEAEVMAKEGIEDIFLAYPLIGSQKILRAVELAKKVRLILGVDSMAGAEALSQAATASGIKFEIFIEVDTDLKRTGIPYEDAVGLAKRIAKLNGLDLSGIYTFKSMTYNGEKTNDPKLAGEQEGIQMVNLAKKMRSCGLNFKSISGGSSPTAQYVAGIDGITEVRAGNYIFKDMGAVRLGIADIEQCAAMVLSTVVSTPKKNRAVIDSGNKSISADTVLHSYPYFHEGHAVVYGNDDLVFDYLNEEHGMITSKSGCTNLRVGQRVLLVPTHVCTTINLHDSVYFKEEDGHLRKVVVAARGKVQ